MVKAGPSRYAAGASNDTEEQIMTPASQAITRSPSGERVEIALLGAQRPPVLAALEEKFTVHKVCDAPDPLAALREVGPRIRGAASHGMAGISRAQIDLMPNLEICAINGVGLETSDQAGLPRARHRADDRARPVRRRRRPRGHAGAGRLPPDPAGRPLRARRPVAGRAPAARAQVHRHEGRADRPRPHRHRGRAAARRVQDRDRLCRPGGARRARTATRPASCSWRATPTC